MPFHYEEISKWHQTYGLVLRFKVNTPTRFTMSDVLIIGTLKKFHKIQSRLFSVNFINFHTIGVIKGDHVAGKAKPLEERFKAKVKETPTCWEWTGYKDKNGFGQINLGPRGSGIDYAHRVSFRLYCGDIIDGLSIIQKCGNRSCVNPKHLLMTIDKQARMTTDLRERLMSRVVVNDESHCWEYQNFKNDTGYGRLGYGARNLGVDYAHRISYEVHYGEIPEDKFVLHKCDNPSCVNPEHLFLGTQNDNVQDAINKGRMWYQK